MKKLRTILMIVVLTCIVGTASLGVGVAAFPRTVHAQAATVPIGTLFDFNNIMAHLKDFVLDHLAVLVAKQILHQITLSVINWINSGYKGSPGFVTNPSQFFENAADQVTGAFIASDGPLSQLCSPFSVNIRVGLALQQSQFTNQKYACTLNSIIKNASNLPNNIYVNGQRVGGAPTINGFMSGNFSQGGWPAFIALTTEPQNNPYGAYLESASELRTNIALRHGSLTFDLQLGNGFLSWSNCTDITADVNSQGFTPQEIGLTSSQFNNLSSKPGKQGVTTGQADSGAQESIQKVSTPAPGGVGPPSVSYQDCETQTPGSAIASKLFTNINSPEVELELANDINAVINAAISQMVSQMLSQGLHALSGNSGTGGATSYTSQALQSVLNQTNAGVTASQGQATAYIGGTAQTALTDESLTYTQAINIASSTRASFEAARQCFANQIASPNGSTAAAQSLGQQELAAIDSYVSINIDPLLTTLTADETTVTTNLATLTNGTSIISSSNPASTDDVQSELPAYQSTAQSSITAGSTAEQDQATADQELTTVQTKMAAANTIAAQFGAACQTFPNSTIPTATVMTGTAATTP